METILNLMENQKNNYASIEFESDYKYDGNIVPRVTKILSRCIHNDALMYWANSLGFKHKSYQKTLNEAANIGTQCHNSIDSFMEDNTFMPSANINQSAKYAYESFRVWFSEIATLNNVKVIFHEKQIVCPYFGGTVDGLYEINGKTCLIDYKTSNHISINYYLQLAAYRYILENYYNMHIDTMIILQLSKTGIGWNQILLDLSDPAFLAFANQCETTFLSLAYSYINLAITEDMFKKLNLR